MVSKIRMGLLGIIFITFSAQRNKVDIPKVLAETPTVKLDRIIVQSNLLSKKNDTLWLKLDTIQKTISDQLRTIKYLISKQYNREVLSEMTDLDTTIIPLVEINNEPYIDTARIFLDVPKVKRKKTLLQSIFNRKK